MKQFEVKSQKTLSGNKFFIRPYPAFVAANLSGEITALVVPILASLAPVFVGASKGEEVGLLDMNAEAVAPALASGLSAMSGDRVEILLKKLLTKYGNVSVELADDTEVQTLTDDLANEVFCGDAQDMFILAFEVIKVNYSGFFKKLGGQFGGALSGLLKG